jgi:hypothetical protein
MKVAILTWCYRAWAYLLASTHYRTIWHTFMAYWRGIGQTIAAVTRFVNAASKPELRMADPVRHHKETAFRRWMVGGVVILISLLALLILGIAGRVGALLLFLVQAVLFTAIGRTDALVVRVKTRKLATEQLLLRITNDLTLTAAMIKQEYSASIVQTPVRLFNNRGYDAIVRVHDQGKPHLLVANPAGVAHKLNKGRSTVFTYGVKLDESQVRILVLDVDPWSLPPTVNPLVARPRQLNLWRETVSMGTQPDFTDTREQMVEAGDGGGRLAGGAPRYGKSVLLSNWIVALCLDPTTHMHIIDGSAVDFQAVEGLCANYVGDAKITDVQLLAKAHAVLKELKAEIARRKVLLFKHGTNKLSEELSDQYRLGTHWFICDELAVITEDLFVTNKKAVEEFLSDLQWLVRMGPKYGVFVILATQRPSEKSIPPTLSSLIVLRTALYIPDVHGAQAILKKSGANNRPDKLDPEQKGVAINTKIGQYRIHLVETQDLARVAQFAASIRAQYSAGTTTPDTTMEHPEPVRTLLEIMDELKSDQVETLTLIEHLVDRGYTKVTEKNLAQSLKPWGIASKRFYGGDGRRWGYSRVELERVPKIRKILSSAIPGTDRDGAAQDDWDGIEVAAHRDGEDGS